MQFRFLDFVIFTFDAVLESFPVSQHKFDAILRNTKMCGQKSPVSFRTKCKSSFPFLFPFSFSFATLEPHLSPVNLFFEKIKFVF